MTNTVELALDMPQHVKILYWRRVNKNMTKLHHTIKKELLEYTVRGQEIEQQSKKIHLTKDTYSTSTWFVSTSILLLLLDGTLAACFAPFVLDAICGFLAFFVATNGVSLLLLPTSNALGTILLKRAERLSRELCILQDRRKNSSQTLSAERADSFCKWVSFLLLP